MVCALLLAGAAIGAMFAYLSYFFWSMSRLPQREDF
jgi:nitrogen fixation-related uncharacterized protein